MIALDNGGVIFLVHPLVFCPGFISGLLNVHAIGQALRGQVLVETESQIGQICYLGECYRVFNLKFGGGRINADRQLMVKDNILRIKATAQGNQGQNGQEFSHQINLLFCWF